MKQPTQIVHAARVRLLAKAGGELVLVKGRSRLTDEARDLAARLKLKLIWKDAADLLQSSSAEIQRVREGRVQVALASDHGGWELKSLLQRELEREGYTVQDLGCPDSQAVDYPVYARALAEEVASGKAARGIMVDSVGVASAMVCNRIAGVRAAACESMATALSSRKHNDANVLTLGGKMLDHSLALQMASAWLKEAYEGGRHQKRVDLIMALDR